MSRLHIAGVHLSEYGLYALLLLRPLTGLADTLARGHPFGLFAWQVPALIARRPGDPSAGAPGPRRRAPSRSRVWSAVHATAALAHRLIILNNSDVLESTCGAGGGCVANVSWAREDPPLLDCYSRDRFGLIFNIGQRDGI